MKQIACVVLVGLLATCSAWAASGADFEMEILPAATSIGGPAGGTAAGSVDLSVVFTSKVGEVQGWSFGVQAVPAAGVTMDITDVAKSSQLLTLKDGAPADFSTTAHYLASNLAAKVGDCKPTCTGIASAAVTQGCVIDFDAVITMPATTDFTMITMKVAVSGPVGTVAAEAGRVVFTDAVGSPPVGTLGVVGGNSYTPDVREPAVVSFQPKTCVLPRDFTLWMTGGECGTGDAVESIVSLNFNGNNTGGAAVIQGWSYGVCVDSLLAITDATTAGMDVATVKAGGAPDYNKIVKYANGVFHGVVIDYDAIVTLPARNDFTDLKIAMTANVTEADPVANIRSCNETLGSPPVANVVVIEGDSFAFSLFDGVLAQRATDCCEEALENKACNMPAEFKFQAVKRYAFVPGSANGDRRLDIADGIYILNALFRGGPAIKCMKAADANGDCAVDASDAVYIIMYLFHPGSTPAPAPVNGVGCQIILDDVCPALSCDVPEDCTVR